MATHDYVIANASGAAVRADLNNALAAIVSNNSNATEPATTYAYQWWADTTAEQLKLRNAANDDWIVIQELDGTLLMEDGTAAAPGLAFASDTDTGILRPGANQLAIATNGVERIEIGTTEIVVNDGGVDIDFRVEGDTESNLLLVDAGADVVRIGGGYNILKGFNRRPPIHRGPLFFRTTASTISVVADCSLNGFFYNTATAVTMPSHSNNTDYAIWQHPTTGALVADASFTSAPVGATGGSIVGGYHYIPSGRPTAFNGGSPVATPEILRFSLWDLTWRPVCPDPRGMTCVDERFWCDIYFCGTTAYATSDFTAVPSSKIGVTIADDENGPLIPANYGGNGSLAYTNTTFLEKGCWYDFCEIASSFSKRLPWLHEFQVAAYGGPEQSSRGSDPGTVQWERVSLWGLAQSTGVMQVWGANTLFRDVNSDVFQTTLGYTRGRGGVFQQGNENSLVTARLGGGYLDITNSGSRFSHWGGRPWLGAPTITARFVADHLITS